MNPLLRRLASLRMKVRFLDGWQGICAVLGLVLGVTLAVIGLDYWVHLPSLVRALALVGILIGGGMVAFRKIYQPFVRPCDDLSLALRIEELYPEMNDALASTVQFMKQSKDDQERIGGSASMREMTIRETLDRAEQWDFARVIDRRSAFVFGALALGVLLVAGFAVAKNRQYVHIALMRLIEPFGQHTWTQIAVSRNHPDEDKKWVPLDPAGQDKIAIGRPYAIKVDLSGKVPPQATVEVVNAGQIRSDKTFVLKPGETSFIVPIDMTQQYQKFKFRVTANDGAFPNRSGAWHEVAVLPPPTLIDLDGQPSPQITVYPPAYTDLAAPTKLAAGLRHLEVFAGTNVVLRAKADRPLEQAWIEYRPENAEAVISASILACFGQVGPLQAVAQAATSQSVWGRFSAVFDADGATFQITFMPWVSGGYILHLRDNDKLERHEASDLRVQLDPVPDVKLLLPTMTTVTRVPDADIAFKMKVTDEFFAVRSIYVEYRRKNPDGSWVAGEDWQRNVLYGANEFGAMIPYLFTKMGRAMWMGPDLRLRFKEVDLDMTWSLRGQFKEGDLVVVEVCADDFCDIYPKREPGRSRAIELHIVSVSQIVRDTDAKLAELQQDVHRLEQMQKNALAQVNETKKTDKIDQKAKDVLNEAEQTQREIQEMIGRNPDQGLRHDLKDLMQTLKDNKLTNTQANKELGKMKGTMDKLATQELPQIEPRLADARNDLAQSDKNKPATKKKLEETAKLQQKVQTALNELNKDLAPYQSTLEMRVKLSDLIEKQQLLQKKLDELNTRKRDFEKENPDKKEETEQTYKEEVLEKAREQKDLAKQLEGLIKDMQSAKEMRDRNGDKENANKIEESLKKLTPDQKDKEKAKPNETKKPEQTKPPTTAKMKDVAKQLDNKSEAPQQALDQQKEILKDLDEALKILEGRNQDFAKQEIQKRQDIEKDLEKLNKDLRQLQDQSKKADQIKDMEERLKRKQELAAKHGELQEKLEKAARELARLQEQRAANNVDEAAKNVEKAGQKLQQGGDPQDEQKQAEQKIDQAKEDLKLAEEQLARELLIQMADKLKALKERQDAVLKRSEDFHPKVLKRKSWTDALLDTIDGNIDAQAGIADETDSLKDKLKEAKVFFSILERAKDSMDKAGETMKLRQAEGKERRYVEKGDGEVMDDKELKDEADWQATTVKHQKQASQRLDRILDALKQELNKKPRDNDVAKNEEPKAEEKQEPQQGMRNADGIPPTAQLKALKSEQIDLNERTEEFAQKHADVNKLDENQRRELHDLELEQQRLQELFQDLVAPAPQKEGDLP